MGVVTLWYRNRDKLWPDGPLGSYLYVDFILPYYDPLFLQYSNVYIPTPEVNQLTHDTKLQEECLRYVGKKGWLEHCLPKNVKPFGNLIVLCKVCVGLEFYYSNSSIIHRV